MKKKVLKIIGQILLIILPIIFAPYITQLLCNIGTKKVNFQGQIIDNETLNGISAEISFDGTVFKTDSLGNFNLKYISSYSSYPGCPSCGTTTILSFKVLKDEKFSIYEFPVDENTSKNPSKIEFTFPK